jgi:hypothetical protein
MNDFRVTLHDLTDEQKSNRILSTTIKFVRPTIVDPTDEELQSIQDDLRKIMEHVTKPYDGKDLVDNAGDLSEDLSKALNNFLSTDKRFKWGVDNNYPQHYYDHTETRRTNMEPDDLLEQEIQAKGLTAPRLTPALIESKIDEVSYYVFENTCLTVCVLTLENGFTVTGESACASPENFNQEIGESIAYKNAMDKIWTLEGYLLKQRLYEASL